MKCNVTPPELLTPSPLNPPFHPNRNCTYSDSDYVLTWEDCDETIIPLVDVGCEEGEDSFYGYPCEEMQKCADRALGNYWGALITFATLILALNGCLTRIKKVADTNLQKILGMVPDINGVLSLMATLQVFKLDCYDSFPTRIVMADGKVQEVWSTLGGGWRAFLFCWVAAVIRCTMHILTPVPEGGGFHCIDSLEYITGMDLDGNGEVSSQVVKDAVQLAKDEVKNAKDKTAEVAKKTVEVGSGAAAKVKHLKKDLADSASSKQVIPVCDAEP